METALIRRIKVVDDNPAVRDSYGFSIQLAERTPVLETGPLGTLEQYLAREFDADAAIADYQLRPSKYAFFDGIDLVAEWYKRHKPAVLCTTFHKSNVVQFRKFRRWVPVVMSPEDLDPDTLMLAFELVANELNSQWAASRRPWRAQIHFVEVDLEMNAAIAKIPAWSDEAVTFGLKDLPDELQTALRRKPDARCHAEVNLGTEHGRDLYVTRWEV